jgi:hypothetical protein
MFRPSLYVICLSLTVLFPATPPQALADPPPTLASTYQCSFNNSPLARALSVKQSLRLAAATTECLKYCQTTYPCGPNDLNAPACSKLKACIEACG